MVLAILNFYYCNNIFSVFSIFLNILVISNLLLCCCMFLLMLEVLKFKLNNNLNIAF